MQINKSLIFISLVVIAMLSRLIPHAPNFTAVAAAGLFAGFAFGKDLKAILVPLIALWLSDLLINNIVYASHYDGFTFFTEGFGWIYAGMIVSVFIGSLGTRNFKVPSLLAGGVGATLAFYLLTNFGAWMGNPLYTKDISGLITAYIAGLPFLLNQALGTLVYGSLLFGAAYALRNRFAASSINA